MRLSGRRGSASHRPGGRTTLLHTQPSTASKNISLPEDVYRKLAEEKREGESFGDVIDRLLRGRPLTEFWGAWSEETAERAREAVEVGREESEEKLEQLYD